MFPYDRLTEFCWYNSIIEVVDGLWSSGIGTIYGSAFLLALYHWVPLYMQLTPVFRKMFY